MPSSHRSQRTRANDAKTGAKSFTVTGDFSAQDVMAALQKVA